MTLYNTSSDVLIVRYNGQDYEFAPGLHDELSFGLIEAARLQHPDTIVKNAPTPPADVEPEPAATPEPTVEPPHTAEPPHRAGTAHDDSPKTRKRHA